MNAIQLCLARGLTAVALAAAGCTGAHQGSTQPLLPKTRPVADRAAQPLSVVQYPAPSQPWEIASDGAGHDWFSECDRYSNSTIAEIDESSGKFSEFKTSFANSCKGGVALGRNKGGMWFTDPEEGKIGLIWFKTHKFNVYRTPTKNSIPNSIAAGFDNAMWFTEAPYNSRGKIGRLDLSHHPYKITEYKLRGLTQPQAITRGPDNAMWFTDELGGIIGRIDSSFKISYFFANGSPIGITVGADGGIWFTEVVTGSNAGSYIGRIDPRSYQVTQWQVISGDGHSRWPILQDVTSRGSHLWVTENYGNDAFVCFNIYNHRIHEYELPAGSAPQGITVGTDNDLWLTEPGTNALGKILPPGPCAS